jgi:hypothetical protein
MQGLLSMKIQIVSIVVSLSFLFLIARLIVRGKIREEYSIVWLCLTVLLLVFSIWREGLNAAARLLGVFYPPSLVFMAAILAITVFLVHLSIVVTKLQRQLKEAAQEIALLKAAGDVGRPK